MTAVSLIVFAASLVGLGVGSYLLTGQKSITALIPAFAGVLVGVFATVAEVSSGLLRSMAWASAVVALLGVVATSRGLQACIAALLAKRGVGAAAISKALMCGLCIAFVAAVAVQGI
jgi:hypothetical protein